MRITPPPHCLTTAKNPLWLAIIASLSVPAFADTTATTPSTTLETMYVTVTGKTARTEHNKAYATSAMSTTTGLLLTPRETPQSVSVITKAQIDDKGITSLADALKNTTGVNVLIDSGGGYRFQSRGFYMDQIEEDGIATTVPGSAYNLYQDAQSLTDMAAYDHIEVVRGATGLTQSFGSPGGTVNAVFKKPTRKRSLTAGIQGNNFGNVRTTLDLSGSLNETQSVRGRSVIALERTDTFRDRTDGKKGMIYGVLEGDAGDNGTWTAGALYQKTDAPDVAGLPMRRDGSPLGLSTKTNLSADWGEMTKDKYNVFGEFKYHFGSNWTLDNKLAYQHDKSDSALSSTSRPASFSEDTVRTGIQSKYHNKRDLYTFKSNLVGKFPLFGQENDVFATYTFAKEKNTSTNIDAKFDNTLTYNVYTFDGKVPVNWDSSNYSWYSDAVRDVKTHSLLLGTRINPTANFHVIAGANYTRYDGTFTEDGYNYNRNRPYNSASAIKKNYVTPYAGITYDVDTNNSVYASYTTIYKPSSNIGKDGNLVDPVEGVNYELGWKGAWRNNRLNASLAIFDLREQNRPVTITTAMDPSASRNYTATIGKVASRGFETEVSGAVTDNLRIFGGYTYNTSKYLQNETTTRVAGLNFSTHTPAHIARLYGAYQLPFAPKWTIGAGMQAYSDTTSLNGIRQGGYTLYNANVQYAPNDRLRFSIIGDNLSDKRYFETHRTRNADTGNYYGEPLKVSVKMDVKFF